MNQDIINKYSIAVPRYTSYPPANFFNESFSNREYEQAIVESNEQLPQHISIYIHIPFCNQMCYYCGCNAQLMTDKSVVDRYIDAVKKEMRLVLPLLSPNRKISQIHYGGGTPTSLPIAVLKDLNDTILSEFGCIDQPEIAIECHPGYMTEEYWEALPEIGFNRLSIGIQDFNDAVLMVSHRKKSRFPIEDIVRRLRERNVSVNLDFIYGLPLQTVESFTDTIEKAIAIQPDRIVTFSYAHVPWVNPLQQKLEEAGLPTSTAKNELFDTATRLLNDAGYKSIGLDHFVQPDDELYRAMTDNSLHRNFQGYCTRRTTGQVYAFGVTGISQLANSYSQNVKDIPTYIEMIDREQLPVAKGYSLNAEEQITRAVIATLMCNYAIEWNEMASTLELTVEDIKQAVNYDKEALAAFAADGIIEFDDERIVVLPHAKPLVRNVAASLDKLFLNSDKQFSKSV